MHVDVGRGIWEACIEKSQLCGRTQEFVVATVWCLVDRLGLLLVAACPPEHAAVSGENDA